LFAPTTRARSSNTFSPASAKLPLRLKSTKASSRAAAEAVTVTSAVSHVTRAAGRATPSSSSTFGPET
jgi:hypothetical protein